MDAAVQSSRLSAPVYCRVGLIGDVHGEGDALATALRFLSGISGLDALLCTGDIPGKRGMGDTERCCQLLREAGVLTIRGNHDRWWVENDTYAAIMGYAASRLSRESQRFLTELPPCVEFTTPQGLGLLCHGMGNDDMAGIYPGGDDDDVARALQTHGLDHYAVIVAGHTHKRMLRPVGKTLVLNPGTLFWEENPGFLILDFPKGYVRRFDLTPFTNEITETEPVRLPELPA